MKISRSQFNQLHKFNVVAPGLFEATLQRLPPPQHPNASRFHALTLGTLGDTGTTTSANYVDDVTSVLTAALPVYAAVKKTAATPVVTPAATTATLAKYGISTSSMLPLILGAAAIGGLVLFMKKRKKAS